VQNVISSLNIAKVIYKDEKDPDVKKYLNEKSIFEIEIKSGDIIR
jgi:ERCC4-related helicase